MGLLREIETEKRVALEPEHVVGRALTCALCLDYGYVSAQHAMIRHDGQGWVVRDLASRNGTWLDGRRIPPGDEHHLPQGSRLGFGVQSAQWEMLEDGPPDVMVVPLDGSLAVRAEGDLIALPSPADPRATIYRVNDGWVLEEGDAPSIPLANLRVFQCVGRAWRFSCPSNVRATIRSDAPPSELRLRDLRFEFNVSLDEEHVDVRGRAGDVVVELGERTHHYLLLTLARERLLDAAAGMPETACGWVDVETIWRGSQTTRGQISVDVFRLRRQLIEHAVVDAPAIIERRPGQLRIGTANLTIARR